MQDKLMPILVVDQTEALHRLFTEVMGFEEGVRTAGDPGELVIYSYGSSNVGVATPGALPAMPPPTSSSLLVFEIADAQGIQRVMASRDADSVGALSEGYFGRFFDVSDGSGHVFRFLEKSQEVSYAAE